MKRKIKQIQESTKVLQGGGLYSQMQAGNYTKLKEYTRQEIEDICRKVFRLEIKVKSTFAYHKTFLSTTLKLIGL